MRDVYNPVTRIRISQFDIRARFQRGVDLFNSRINTSFELYNQRNEVANSETLEAIRLYRLERRGVLIQDSALHAETTSTTVNNAQRDLQENHNDIIREIEANSMTGFFQRFRRGSVFLIISGSLTILLNTSIRNNIYDFISNLLKTIVRISNDSPASVSTGGLDSNPTGVISIPPNDIVGGTPLQCRLLISHL